MDPLRKCRAVSRCRRLFSKLHNFSGETPSVSDTKKIESKPAKHLCVDWKTKLFRGQAFVWGVGSCGFACPLFLGSLTWSLFVPGIWEMAPGSQHVSTVFPGSVFSLETLTYPVCVLTLTIAPVQVYLLLHIFHVHSSTYMSGCFVLFWVFGHKVPHGSARKTAQSSEPNIAHP